MDDGGWRPAQVVHGYRLGRRLGSGGFGEVWLAERFDGELVALKRPLSVACLPALARGVSAQGRLRSRWTAPVLEVRLVGDEPFVAYAYASRGTLAERLASGPLGPDPARLVLAAVLGSLAEAHELGEVHGDVKPSNVLVHARGTWLTDYGGGEPFGCANSLTASGGGLPVTAAYASPEVLAGAAPAPSADVYATGLLLFELVTGRRLSGVELPSSSVETGLPSWVDEAFRVLCAPLADRPANAAAALARCRSLRPRAEAGSIVWREEAAAPIRPWRWRECGSRTNARPPPSNGSAPPL